MKILPRSFYQRDTVQVAKELLGKKLVRKIGKQTLSGTISETEAYRSYDDPASHSYRGMTNRNTAMFGEVGRAYVYFTYGMYYCVNVVARSKNFDAGAVLIRSIVPEQGILKMQKNRKKEIFSNLTNGPAKLTQALKIDKRQYGTDLSKLSELYILDSKKNNYKIFSGQRIGIKNGKNKLWNFRLELN